MSKKLWGQLVIWSLKSLLVLSPCSSPSSPTCSFHSGQTRTLMIGCWRCCQQMLSRLTHQGPPSCPETGCWTGLRLNGANVQQAGQLLIRGRGKRVRRQTCHLLLCLCVQLWCEHEGRSEMTRELGEAWRDRCTMALKDYEINIKMKGLHFVGLQKWHTQAYPLLRKIDVFDAMRRITIFITLIFITPKWKQ